MSTYTYFIYPYNPSLTETILSFRHKLLEVTDYNSAYTQADACICTGKIRERESPQISQTAFTFSEVYCPFQTFSCSSKEEILSLCSLKRKGAAMASGICNFARARTSTIFPSQMYLSNKPKCSYFLRKKCENICPSFLKKGKYSQTIILSLKQLYPQIDVAPILLHASPPTEVSPDKFLSFVL